MVHVAVITINLVKIFCQKLIKRIFVQPYDNDKDDNNVYIHTHTNFHATMYMKDKVPLFMF